eukprot:360885-Chlamydomonas_euryale.AAC.5
MPIACFCSLPPSPPPSIPPSVPSKDLAVQLNPPSPQVIRCCGHTVTLSQWLSRLQQFALFCRRVSATAESSRDQDWVWGC